MEICSTKEKILNTAIIQFSDIGYDKVSMRDIASEVGIKAASIYNHFPSKRDILKSIYKFYADQHSSVLPNMEEALLRLETEPIYDVLMKLNYYWPSELQDRMDRIILIAGQRMCMDSESERFIHENFFGPRLNIWYPLLNRAAELGKIEPIDVETFVRLVTYYAFSAAGLNRTMMKISLNQWNEGLSMLFSLIREKEKR